MKKVLLLAIISLFVSVGANAQKFVAIMDGLKDSSNLEKSYVVLNFEGKTSAELYDLTNKFCQKVYSNPKNSLTSDIKNEFIRIKTYSPNAFLIKKVLGTSNYCSIEYSVNFSFKDGKVKFEITNVTMWSIDNRPMTYHYVDFMTWSIFKGNGEPRDDLAKKYQSFFNSYISEYVKFVNTNNVEKENW